jgi:hypothetical protein
MRKIKLGAVWFENQKFRNIQYYGGTLYYLIGKLWKSPRAGWGVSSDRVCKKENLMARARNAFPAGRPTYPPPPPRPKRYARSGQEGVRNAINLDNAEWCVGTDQTSRCGNLPSYNVRQKRPRLFSPNSTCFVTGISQDTE